MSPVAKSSLTRSCGTRRYSDCCIVQGTSGIPGRERAPSMYPSKCRGTLDDKVLFSDSADLELMVMKLEQKLVQKNNVIKKILRQHNGIVERLK